MSAGCNSPVKKELDEKEIYWIKSYKNPLGEWFAWNDGEFYFYSIIRKVKLKEIKMELYIFATLI